MKKQTLITVIGLLALLIAHQNCAQTPFGVLGLSTDEADFSSTEESTPSSNPYALLSAEQLFKSMESVTGTPASGTIVNEYRARANLFGTGNDLRLVTAPMLIGTANLASQFCNETLSREIAQAAAQRKFFTAIDFARPVSTLSEDAYRTTLAQLGRSFWGRSPSSVESQILLTGKSEFVAGLTTAEAGQTNSTRNLMLFTCTGMLASFESLIF